MATLQSLVGKYFGDLGPETVNLMTQIAMAESSGNVGAYNPQDPYGGSYGLFQINGVHGYDPQRLMSDPEYNLMAARQVYDKQGPQAWSTYGQVAGGGGGYMPTQESEDGWDGNWFQELWDTDDGGEPMPETGGGDPSQSILGRQLTDNDIGPLLQSLGYKHISGWGPTAIWEVPADGKDPAFKIIQSELANEMFPDSSPYMAQKSGSGFSLSPGQTRYDASGRPIATAPTPQDPYAQVKLQQAGVDLQIKQTNLRFLQDKFAFEMSQGLRKEANSTRQQIFSNQMDLTRLQMEMQQQKQRLAMDIGALAADPGDRAKFAASVTALGGQWGKSVTDDQRTDDSLMPLESLLRQQEGLGGVTPPTAPQFAMPPSGIDLTALMRGTANPAAVPQMQTGPTPPYVPEGTTEIPDTAPNVMPPESGVDLQSLIAGADGDIPTRGHGGIEDEAFIAGEAGPEIVIPMGKGKTAVLNEGQAEALGINLKKLTKMALGGIFDGLVADQDRSKSRGFLDESVARSLKGTPWQSADDIADPVVAAGPSVDPLVAQIMASINAMAKGVPVSYYQRQAALMRPQGVAEGPVRRSA